MNRMVFAEENPGIVFVGTIENTSALNIGRNCLRQFRGTQAGCPQFYFLA